MEYLSYILIIYIWLNVGLIASFKLLTHGKKLDYRTRVVIYISLPLLTIIEIISYLYTKGKVTTTMTNTHNNNLKKSISNIIDKGAIRFINFLDALRGNYAK